MSFLTEFNALHIPLKGAPPLTVTSTDAAGYSFSLHDDGMSFTSETVYLSPA